MDKTPPKVLYYITIFCKPDVLVPTIHGQMTYRQWLEEIEMPRAKKRGWPVFIEENTKTGEIALAHEHVKLPRSTPKKKLSPAT